MGVLNAAEIDAAGGDALARAPLEAPLKLKRTRAALGRAATGSTTPSLILHIGDSTERTPYLSGTGIPSGGAQLATSYRLAKKLGALGYKTTTNAVFGANGFSAANMTSYDPRVTFGAGWAPGSQQSLGGSMFANASDTSTLAFAFSEAFNRIVVYYRTNPLNGVFTVDIGGAVLQTVTTGTADTFASAQIDTGVAAAPGSVNIKRVSGTLEIIGIVAYDSTNPGLIFINGARGGWNSSNWVAVGQGWHPSNVVRTLAPALIIDGNGGVNDVDNNLDPTTPFIGLTTFIANKRAALNLWSPVSDILLETLPPQDATWAVIANQDQYAQAVRDLAKEYGFALYDQYSRLVSRSDANLYGNYGDPRHPSPIAHDDRATALVRLLTQ